MFVISVFVILLFVYLTNAFKLKSWYRSVRLALNLPGPPAVLFFGNMFLLNDRVGFIKSMINSHKCNKPLFRFWLTITPFIAIIEPKHIQAILGSTKHTNKSYVYSFMHTFLGEGLLTNSGKKWKSHRKLIQPFFHINKLKLFIKTFTEASERLVDELKDLEEVQITTHINNCVFNILHSALLGIPVNDTISKIESPFNKGHFVVLERMTKPHYMLNFFYKFSTFFKRESSQRLTLRKFSKKFLDQRRPSLGDKEWCLLDAFIEISEKNSKFSKENIVEELCTFMLAGQDSVSAAVSFTLYNLAKHPEVQDKVVRELKEIFGRHPEITLECLKEMVYLKQCIKESLRLFPSVPILSRTLLEDVQINEYTLPAGANVIISPIGTHRLEKYYPNPEKFDPERFSKENKKNLHSFAFIPFSAGSRNCIGFEFAYLEMKAIISTVLRDYVITVPPDYELEVAFRITLRSKGGIKLQLKRRTSNNNIGQKNALATVH